MKKFWMSTTVLLFVCTAHAEIEMKGAFCGTRGNLWGTIASEFVIPDFFPPENPLLKALLDNDLIDLSVCEENFSPAHLGASCMMHDQCYASYGATKTACDDDLKQGWLESCQQSFSGMRGFMCRSACTLAVNIMHTAMRYNVGGFCPSCDAFERSQKNAVHRSSVRN